MPWTCPECQQEVSNDLEKACPGCGRVKAAWTVLDDHTRAMTVARRPRLVVRRGVEGEPLRPEALHEGRRAEAQEARPLPRAAVARLSERELLPAAQDLVYIHVRPPKRKDPEVRLSVLFAGQETRDESHLAQPLEEGEDCVLVVAFVYAAGEVPPPPGVVLIDVSEGEGYGSAVEISFGKRASVRLPLRAQRDRGRVVTHFSAGSILPRVGALAALREVVAELNSDPSLSAFVFGHADPDGSPRNDELSSRRAEAVFALLRGDLATWERAAEGWTLADQQACLRALGCNPGAIDGVSGPLTEAAVLAFQEDYNAQVFHRDRARAYGPLAEDGLLGPRTREALLDAFLAEASPGLPSERFLGAGFAGCGERHPRDGEAASQRRAVVALFSDPDPEHFVGEPPPAVERYPSLVEEQAPQPEHAFSDYAWLEEEERQVHLSALTTQQDQAQVNVAIYRAPVAEAGPLAGWGAPPSPPGAPIATLEGRIERGVLFARWVPDDDQDPFEVEEWYPEPADAEEEAEDAGEDYLLGDPATLRPPVFEVASQEAWGRSGAPCWRLSRVRFEGVERAEGIAVGLDGREEPFEVVAGRVDSEREVIALRLLGRQVEVR